MNVQEMLQGLADRVSSSASVKYVYGDPVVVGERTVIPAAQVRYAFGGGGGRHKLEPENSAGAGAGGGAGGGARACPVGALEISPQGTRFLRFNEPRTVRLAFVAGLLAGAAVAAMSMTRRVEIRKSTGRRDS